MLADVETQKFEVWQLLLLRFHKHLECYFLALLHDRSGCWRLFVGDERSVDPSATFPEQTGSQPALTRIFSASFQNRPVTFGSLIDSTSPAAGFAASLWAAACPPV